MDGLLAGGNGVWGLGVGMAFRSTDEVDTLVSGHAFGRAEMMRGESSGIGLCQQRPIPIILGGFAARLKAVP